MNIASMVYIRTSIYIFPEENQTSNINPLNTQFMVNFPLYIHLPIYPNVDK